MYVKIDWNNHEVNFVEEIEKVNDKQIYYITIDCNGFYHFWDTFDQAINFVMATNIVQVATEAVDNEALPNEWYTTPRKINNEIHDLVIHHKDWLRDYVARCPSDFFIEEKERDAPDIEYIEVPEKL